MLLVPVASPITFTVGFCTPYPLLILLLTEEELGALSPLSSHAHFRSPALGVKPEAPCDTKYQSK